MCPLCLSAIVWLALGGGSASTLAAVLIGLNLKGKDDGDGGNHASDRDA